MVQGGENVFGAARSSRPKAHCRKSSATRRSCAWCRKAAPRTRWNSSTARNPPQSVAHAIVPLAR